MESWWPQYRQSLDTGFDPGSTLSSTVNFTLPYLVPSTSLEGVDIVGAQNGTIDLNPDGSLRGSTEANGPVNCIILLENQNLTASGSGSQSFTLTVEVGNQRTSAITSLTVNPNPSPSRLYVNTAAQSAHTGLNRSDAFTDLQSALNYGCRQNLTEIWVAAGVDKPTATTDRSSSFILQEGVTIYGGFSGSEISLSHRPAFSGPSSTTLSGEIGDPATPANNSYHVLTSPTSQSLTKAVILDGVVIRDGNANGSGAKSTGGGMYLVSSSPLIQNCCFVNNRASSGGGLYAYGQASGQRLRLVNCAFTGNTATYGGALPTTRPIPN